MKLLRHVRVCVCVCVSVCVKEIDIGGNVLDVIVKQQLRL